MKNKIKIIFACAATVTLLASCEIYDPVDEIARTGKITANVYMEIPNTNVKAGESVAFHAEYWSIDDVYNSLSIWYDVNTVLKYEMTASLTGYSQNLDSTVVAREFQEIVSFPHDASNYVSAKKSYIIDSSFPVSYTLATVSIEDVDEYSESQVMQLFPASFINSFYEGFFSSTENDYDLLKTLLVTSDTIVDAETFDSYFEVVLVENPEGGDPIETMVLKDGAESAMLGYVKQVPLEHLIYNKNKQVYKLLYTRSYELDAKFRVVNGNDVENFSEAKLITVN
jgi:hypothetical protein